MDNFKCGRLETYNSNKKDEYRYFLPHFINQKYIINDSNIILALEQATKLLSELNAYGDLAPDIDFFIKMHILSESVSSSKIEGTRTNMEDALLPENEILEDRRDDWQEVQSYIKSMHSSIDLLSSVPVSLRLIKHSHEILLSNSRGKHKLPGEIRKSQNWIGGVSIKSAHFIPPHHKHLPELLSDWEKFWHEQNTLPILIKIALCHYQFETIHPFLDGNGRIGRLLIILQLIEAEFLHKPILYLSNFFEKNRTAYYQSLDNVRNNNNINQWIILFLEGIIETAKNAKNTLQQAVKLKIQYEEKILSLGNRAKNANKALQILYSDPVTMVRQLQNNLEITYSATNNLINDLVQLGILREATGYSRNRIFIMSDYVNLFVGE